MTTKAYKSTSQEALHLLLDLLPIELHLEKTALHQAMKLKGQGHWPSQSINTKKLTSFETAQQILDKMISNIFSNDPLQKNEKDVTIPLEIIEKRYSISIKDEKSIVIPIQDPNMVIAYCDGSKHSNDNTGYGLCIFLTEDNVTEEFDSLQPFNSVYQSEAFAITRVVTILAEFNTLDKQIEIFSDSQSVLKSLKNSDSDSKTIIKCHHAINRLGRYNKITLNWIPGHEGYQGNVRADVLANQGAEKNEPTASSPPVPHSYHRRIIAQHCKNTQIRRWYSNNISEICHEMLDPLLEEKVVMKKAITSLPTSIIKIIIQMITGHNNLSYHQHRIGNQMLNT